MNSEIIAGKVVKRGHWQGVFDAGATAPRWRDSEFIINSLYNIYASVSHSMHNIDSLNWTHYAGGLYGRTHIVAQPRPSRGRDIKGEPTRCEPLQCIV
jgi:hypothetical protein